MFKVRCTNSKPQYSWITGDAHFILIVGEIYTVINVRESNVRPGHTVYDLEEMPDYGFGEEFFSRLDGRCEKDIIRKRMAEADAELAAIYNEIPGTEYENIGSMLPEPEKMQQDAWTRAMT